MPCTAVGSESPVGDMSVLLIDPLKDVAAPAAIGFHRDPERRKGLVEALRT